MALELAGVTWSEDEAELGAVAGLVGAGETQAGPGSSTPARRRGSGRARGRRASSYRPKWLEEAGSG